MPYPNEMSYAQSAATGAATTALVLSFNLFTLFCAATFTANEVSGDNQLSNRIFGTLLTSAFPSFYIILGIASRNSELSACLVIAGTAMLAFTFIDSISSIKRFKHVQYDMSRYWLDGNTVLKYHIVVRAAYRYNNIRATVFLSALIMLPALQLKTQQTVPTAEDRVSITGFVIEFLASLLILGLTEPLFRLFYPGDALIGECFRLRLMDTPFRATPDSTKMGRWRSQFHRSSFKISQSLETCVCAMRNRVCGDDFYRLSHAYAGVALTLKQRALLRNGGDSPFDEVLKWSCAALVVNDNPVRTAKRIANITQVEFHDTTSPIYLDSKYRRALGRINTAIESHRLVLTTAALLTTVLYYITIGDIYSLAKFIKTILGGS